MIAVLHGNCFEKGGSLGRRKRARRDGGVRDIVMRNETIAERFKDPERDMLERQLKSEDGIVWRES